METRNGGRRHLSPALALALGAALAACSGGGGDNGVPDDISVGITTAGGATTVASGGTLGMKGQVNNASNAEVVWSLSGASCPDSCGTITPTSIDFATYTAPANVTAQFTVVVTATSVQNPAKRAAVTLTVLARACPATASLLQGQYAFLLQGFELAGRAGIATVGSLTADGCGNITAGQVDYHLGPSIAGSAALTGSYSLGPADRRGTIDLAVGGLAGRTFAISMGTIVGGVATRAAMTEMDAPTTGTVLSGSLWRQDPAAFALSRIVGPYAFVLNGWNGSGPREAMGGTVSADGAAHFTAGLVDRKAFNSPPVLGTAWGGTYAAPSSSGRMLMAAPDLSGSSGTVIAYVVDAGHLLVLISDRTATGRVFSGSMLARTGPFGLGSLSGTCAAYQTANYDQPGYEPLTTSVLSLFSADGAGHLTGTSLDVNFGGNHGTEVAAYTYTVTADGQASIYTGTPPTIGGKWYLIGQNTALMLGFDKGVSVGTILPQAAGPFTAASISGSYFGALAAGASIYSTHGSGVATSSGAGTLATVMDLSEGGSVWGAAASGALTVASNGRATDGNGNVVYIVSSDRFLMMNLSTYYPVVQVFER